MSRTLHYRRQGFSTAKVCYIVKAANSDTQTFRKESISKARSLAVLKVANGRRGSSYTRPVAGHCNKVSGITSLELVKQAETAAFEIPRTAANKQVAACGKYQIIKGRRHKVCHSTTAQKTTNVELQAWSFSCSQLNETAEEALGSHRT